MCKKRPVSFLAEVEAAGKAGALPCPRLEPAALGGAAVEAPPQTRSAPISASRGRSMMYQTREWAHEQRGGRRRDDIQSCTERWPTTTSR
jgi:hypothetical protein